MAEYRELGWSAPAFSEPLRYTLRSAIVGIDHGDQFRYIVIQETIIERRLGGFGGVTLAPIFAPERPTYLHAGPALGSQQSNAPDEGAIRFSLDGPEAETAQDPMADCCG